MPHHYLTYRRSRMANTTGNHRAETHVSRPIPPGKLPRPGTLVEGKISHRRGIVQPGVTTWGAFPVLLGDGQWVQAGADDVLVIRLPVVQ